MVILSSQITEKECYTQVPRDSENATTDNALVRGNLREYRHK